MSSDNHSPQLERLYDKGIRFFSPGVYVLSVLALIAVAIAFVRFFFGLEAVTNFDDDYPWGIWKGINIATFIVLGAAGFTTAFIAHIYGHHKYSALSRQGIIFGMLCYTFAPLSLIVDLGRFWAFWHPIFPKWWQGNSVLFEVAMCVLMYVTVLYIEFMPFVIEKYKGKVKMQFPMSIFNKFFEFILWLADFILLRMKIPVLKLPILSLFVILGVVLSCLHQSSLGTLMVISGDKLHPLWQSSMLPLLFLTSAIAIGFPMVAFLSLISSFSFGKKPEMDLLKDLLWYTPKLLGIYLILKIYDLIHRGAYIYLSEQSVQKWAWVLEVGLLVIAIMMLSSARLRKSPNHAFMACALAIVSMAMNRQNVLVTAYRPQGLDHVYVPSMYEVLFTAGLISALILVYRFIVIYVPILKKGDDIDKTIVVKTQTELAVDTPGGDG
jgi:Ni/Fe-hydrogenase subunit HybB-like protein